MLGPSQKSIRQPWCPKLVTGLHIQYLHPALVPEIGTVANLPVDGVFQRVISCNLTPYRFKSIVRVFERKRTALVKR